MAPGQKVEMLPMDDIEAFVKAIETEKQEEAAKKKNRATGAGPASLLPRGPEASES
jgi:20S proteasome subunit alpha 4